MVLDRLDEGRDTAFSRTWAIAPGLVQLCLIGALSTAIAAVSDALSPLVVGVVLGAVVVNVLGQSAIMAPGVSFGSRSLLRAGIVLLGLQLSLVDVAGLGVRGLLVVAMVVSITFFGTQKLGSKLGVSDDLSLLVATGYSICGASAIAAVDGVVEAEEEEAAYAITLVTLCGSLSIFLLPVLGDLLGMHGAAFGTWVGGAVHDVGQVVATASSDDPEALKAAMVVKLTRVVLLAPIVAMISLRRRVAVPKSGSRPAILPLFVLGFLGAILVRSSGLLSPDALEAAAWAEKALLTVALVGLGMGVRVDRMRKLGGRPLVLGAVAWVLVAVVALVGTQVVQ